MIEALVVGLFVGFIIATLGAVKDTKFEPFEWNKYARSIVIGTIGGFVAWHMYPNEDLIIWGSIVLAFERLITEVWKAFFREIPSKPVKFNKPERDSKWIRRK